MSVLTVLSWRLMSLPQGQLESSLSKGWHLAGVVSNRYL
jgi:hypothetical protein